MTGNPPLQLMISSNVAVKAHLAEVIWDKTVSKEIKDKCVWQFLVRPDLFKFPINGELLGSIIIILMSEPITRNVSAAT